ncbi:MAG TPA: DUF4271 domain-containing protein [Arachidicoccus sp.]
MGINAQVNDSASNADTVKNDTVKKHTIAITPTDLSHNNTVVGNHVNIKNDSSALDSVIVKAAMQRNLRSEIFQHKPRSQREQLAFYLPKWFYNTGVAKDSITLFNLHTERNESDIFFFCLLGVLLIVGLIRLFFPKYFRQVFQFILQPRVRKKNLRDSNNAENVVPSVLLNLVFVITAGLCIVQLAKRDFSVENDWKYWLFGATAITVIYLVKYTVIKISGWVFNAVAAASTYNYVVFSINKILGIILIPIIILATYGSSGIVSMIYSASSIVVVALLAYRYIASFILMRGNLRVSTFHFFLYLCAIEILPLLILYKVLLLNLGKII